MYDKINLADLEEQEVSNIEPTLKAVGYELRPKEMRPSVWTFEPGESNNRHKHEAQEELYHVLDGVAEMEVDGETFEITEGDFIVVSPDSWRQITAKTDCTIFAVGAPSVKDDDIRDES